MKIAIRKVWRDLWRNKGRTLLVVMSIAVGVLAVGMIVSSNTLIARQLAVSHAGSQPSHAQVWLNGLVDETAVNNLARMPEIAAISGQLSSGIRWKTHPAGEWQDGNPRALPDYTQQQFDLIELREGGWPSQGMIDVAFNHIDGFGAPSVDEPIYIEVNGVVHSPSEISGHFQGILRPKAPFFRECA